MPRLLSLPALVVAGSLLLAACGGSSSSSSTTAASSSAYAPAQAAGSPRPTSVVGTSTSSLGTFLVDARGRALYLWKADHGAMSACSGACAQAWPPLTATATPKAGGAAKASLLGTIKRADGTREVTYAGHPLYYYAGDSAPKQTNGQGSNSFGSPWWVVSPGGKAIQG